jgi:hypothetical protein
MKPLIPPRVNPQTIGILVFEDRSLCGFHMSSTHYLRGLSRLNAALPSRAMHSAGYSPLLHNCSAGHRRRFAGLWTNRWLSWLLATPSKSGVRPHALPSDSVYAGIQGMACQILSSIFWTSGGSTEWVLAYSRMLRRSSSSLRSRKPRNWTSDQMNLKPIVWI